jgi:hypothetical protein
VRPRSNDTTLGVAPTSEADRSKHYLHQHNMVGINVGRSKNAHVASRATERKNSLPRTAISSSSPLGMMALHLLAQSKKSGRKGMVFLAESENRAERLGAVIHALAPSCDVLVFPRLNTLPFDQLEPSREIAGRRSSVLRRLAKPENPILLLSTAEAVMECLPMPASWSRVILHFRVGAHFPNNSFVDGSTPSDTTSMTRRTIPEARCFMGRHLRFFLPVHLDRSE